MSESKKTQQKWFPLESNPALMNDYCQKLGFQTDSQVWHDVYGIEDWALAMIPQPVSAVVMLYPLTPKQLAHEKANLVESTADGVNCASTSPNDGDVWFIRQRIGNACGTIGLLHSLLNAPTPHRDFVPGSWLASFATATASLDPVQRAALLEADTRIAALHDDATSSAQNQTSRGAADDDEVDTHFVALVHRHGTLYELDGRKAAPVAHGPTSAATLLMDACRVVQEFMARDPDEIRFTILALAPPAVSSDD